MEHLPRQRMYFDSTSDTLLSQLLLDHDFSICELSRTFAVLQDASFNQAHLSLRTITDAYAWSSQSPLGSKLENREAPLYKGCAGLPNVVLDLVIQHFSATRVPFHHIAVEFEPTPTAANEKALLSMTLVHRTWTIPSQRALSSRIQVHGVNGIRRALVSPSIGPRTREVLFTCAVNSDIDEDFDGEQPSEVLPYLTALISKLPNIQRLSVWTYFDEFNFDVGLMRSLLVALKGLDRLKGLWLSHRGFSGRISNGINPCFAELCLVLPEFRALQSLYLEDWAIPTQIPSIRMYTTQTYIHVPKWKLYNYDAVPPPPLDVIPNKHLKTISLTWYRREELPLQHVDWLLHPRWGYGISNLSLSLYVSCVDEGDRFEELVPPAGICGPKRFIASTSKYLSGMTTVQLDLRDDCRNDSFGFTLVPVVDKCSSVRQLRIALHCGYDQQSIADLAIPPTVETLYVELDDNYSHGSSSLERMDGVILHILEMNELPALKTFGLIYRDFSGGEPEDGNEEYQPVSGESGDAGANALSERRRRRRRLRTEDFCASKGLQFVFTRDAVSLVTLA